MAYATISDVENHLPEGTVIDAQLCSTLLDDVVVLIDAYNKNATADAKKVVSCRAVVRAIGTGNNDMPIGATQGTMSALGYSQTWTIGTGGSVGQLYLNKDDKKMLGCGSKIGCNNPYEVSEE